LLAARGIDVSHNDRRSLRGQRHGDRLANAATRASHNRDFMVKTHRMFL
jgi:hypothetical protein